MNLKKRKIDSLLFLIFCLGISITLIIITSSRGINSLNDLVEIKTSIRSIVKQHNGNSISYDMKLSGFRSQFRIISDYENLFEYDELMEVGYFDSLYFAIDSNNLNQLNQSEVIFLLGIRTNKITFLDKEQTFEKDRNTRRYLAPIGGVILIILSIAIYIYRRYYLLLD